MVKRRRNRTLLVTVLILVVAGAGGYAVLTGLGAGQGPQKPMILYVNQGNGIVNGSGFDSFLQYASSRGFNTVFFQVYRQGTLLFSPQTLAGFVTKAHQSSLKIFFSLYITETTDQLPTSIFNLGADGVNLDMPSINEASQKFFLSALKGGFSGVTAATEQPGLNFTLRPDLLVLETYFPQQSGYIKPGIVASIGAWTTSDIDQYRSEFQYALQNSDGVMVFDYAGMVSKGY